MSALPSSAPIPQQDQQVTDPNDAVKVDVARAGVRLRRTRAPFPKEHHQVGDADGSISVKITWDSVVFTGSAMIAFMVF